MERLEIVDISTLPRGKLLKTPLCKKRIRAWNPKVQSVTRSPKTPDPPAVDNAALDTDSHLPPVARAPGQNTPQSIAPSFSQLKIVDISTLPRGKPLETPLCKKRIRAWNPKVQSVAMSPKTPDPPAFDNAAPDTDFHVPLVARAPRQNTPQSIAPSFSQLEIVNISTLPRGKLLETPLCKKRIRAWNPKVQSVERSLKTLDTSADDDAAPDTDTHVPPVASSSPLKKSPQSIASSFSKQVQSVARSPKTLDTTADYEVAPDTDSHVPLVARAPGQNTPQSITPSFSQLEIVDIATLLRGKPLDTPLGKKRKRNTKVQSVVRSPKTPDPPVDDDAAPDTNSSLPPEASSSPPKNTPLSLAPNTCKKVKSVGWLTKKMVTPVVRNSCLPPAASFSHHRQNRPIHKLEIVHISTLPRGKPLETPLRKNRIRASRPKVQSVGRSPKTPDPPVDDDAAPDTNSSLPPEASSSRPKNTPLSLAPNTFNLEIVDMSPPISKQLETPLFKKKRRWIMKVKSVDRSTKTMFPSVVGDATSATNSCLTPAAGVSHRRRNRSIPKKRTRGRNIIF